MVHRARSPRLYVDRHLRLRDSSNRQPRAAHHFAIRVGCSTGLHNVRSHNPMVRTILISVITDRIERPPLTNVILKGENSGPP